MLKIKGLEGTLPQLKFWSCDKTHDNIQWNYWACSALLCYEDTELELKDSTHVDYLLDLILNSFDAGYLYLKSL